MLKLALTFFPWRDNFTNGWSVSNVDNYCQELTVGETLHSCASDLVEAYHFRDTVNEESKTIFFGRTAKPLTQNHSSILVL